MRTIITLVLLLAAAGCAGAAQPGEPAPEVGGEAPGADAPREDPAGREDAERADAERERADREREDRDRAAREAAERATETARRSRPLAPPPADRAAATALELARVEREREAAARAGLSPGAWRAGALLPAWRVVAFYGNPRSTRMGVLGERPPEEMLRRLDRVAASWREADPLTPVLPALHVIAVMATGDPGPDGLYRLRMPRPVLEEVISWAEPRQAIVFMDLQVGRSSVARELEHVLPYLQRPDVHLALDPEWAMGPEQIPGRVVGSLDAADVNHAVDVLAAIVEEHDLPAKILVVHRFTANMLRGIGRIRHDPRVQVVLHMDGWGPPSTKRNTYRLHVAPEPVAFTGFKLFFHNDTRSGTPIMTPEQVLRLSPSPIYIQYQ